ncbi:hypothetical protein [Cryobacterium sp. Y62]|nr:hypothetical protein [Cryobacterium sp. Y62]
MAFLTAREPRWLVFAGHLALVDGGLDKVNDRMSASENMLVAT